MSKATRSQWRLEARAILDALIEKCWEARLYYQEFHHRVREAYPWGLRKTHPYRCKMWNAEAKAARIRYAARVMARTETNGVIVHLDYAADLGCRKVMDGDPAACISCASCDVSRLPPGWCILCNPTRQRWRETWAGFKLGETALVAAHDRTSAAMLADFLDENDWPESAAWVRLNWVDPPAKKRRRKKKEAAT